MLESLTCSQAVLKRFSLLACHRNYSPIFLEVVNMSSLNNCAYILAFCFCIFLVIKSKQGIAFNTMHVKTTVTLSVLSDHL